MSVSSGKDPGQELDNEHPPGSINRSDDDTEPSGGREEDEEDEDDEDKEEEEEREPNLKYTRLTPNLAPVYRGGESTSSFLVAGDKMVCCKHCSRRSMTCQPEAK